MSSHELPTAPAATAFRLDPDESLGAGIRRILLAQIDLAVRDLTHPDIPHDQGIHDFRRCGKRIRAVLRLIRSHRPADFELENGWFRDAARRLAQARDAAAMLESFDRLAKSAGKKKDLAKKFARIRRTLVDHQEQLVAGYNDDAETVQDVLAGLQAARERIAGWAVEMEGLELVSAGLKQTYRQSRKRMARARKSGAIRDLHDWRKSVKYLWSQTEVLQKRIAIFAKPYCRSLHKITHFLGDDHDLAILRRAIESNPRAFGEKRQVQAFMLLLVERRARLQDRAFKLGDKLFAEKPRRYMTRILEPPESKPTMETAR